MHYNEQGIKFMSKIEFLYPDGTVAYEITDDVIQNGSSINVTNQSGVRRTATISVDNWKGIYDSNKNRFFFNQLVKISTGAVYQNGDIEWYSQGVYYITNTNRVFSPNSRTTTFELQDKFSYFDKSAIPGSVQFKVGDDLISWIKSVLALDKGNGFLFDSQSPIFSNYFFTHTYTVQEIRKDSETGETETIDKEYYYYQCPQNDLFQGQYSDVLIRIANLMFASIGYDAQGHLRLESQNADVYDYNRPILWNFNTSNSTISSIDYSDNQQQMYNHIVINGAVVDGKLMTGEAIDQDPKSNMNYKYIGKITKYEQNQNLRTERLCQEYAEFLLNQYRKEAETITIQCAPLPHLSENCLITVQKDGVDDTRIPYIITGMTIPVSSTDQMTITASRVTFPVEFADTIVESNSAKYPLGVFELNTLY